MKPLLLRAEIELLGRGADSDVSRRAARGFVSFRLELENELSLSLPVRRLKGLGFARTSGRSGHRVHASSSYAAFRVALAHQNGTLVIKFIPNIILALTIFLVVSADTYGTCWYRRYRSTSIARYGEVYVRKNCGCFMHALRS